MLGIIKKYQKSLNQLQTGLYRTLQCLVLRTYRYYRDGQDGQEEDWMKKEDFYGGRTGPLQCEVQRMRSCTQWQICCSLMHLTGNNNEINIIHNYLIIRSANYCFTIAFQIGIVRKDFIHSFHGPAQVDPESYM